MTALKKLFCWIDHLKYRIVALLAVFLLSACAIGPGKAPFSVDGGKTVNLPVTRTGEALPAKNKNYKIEFAGVIVSLKKGNASESKLIWGFSFTAKKSIEFDSVIVEQVTESGGLKLVIKDDSPTLEDKIWIGQSAPVPMTKDLLPWLYSGSDSTFVFKFTITAKNGSSMVMYQPSIIHSDYKARCLRTISGK